MPATNTGFSDPASDLWPGLRRAADRPCTAHTATPDQRQLATSWNVTLRPLPGGRSQLAAPNTNVPPALATHPPTDRAPSTIPPRRAAREGALLLGPGVAGRSHMRFLPPEAHRPLVRDSDHTGCDFSGKEKSQKPEVLSGPSPLRPTAPPSSPSMIHNRRSATRNERDRTRPIA